VLGLFVGLAGGSFSVGIAYVARWFERGRQGMAMGIFGAGNSGVALTKFVAPHNSRPVTGSQLDDHFRARGDHRRGRRRGR
jgi:nitrate/nitrite transporter NarK